MSYLDIKYAKGQGRQSAYPDYLQKLLSKGLPDLPLVVDVGSGNGAFSRPWRGKARMIVTVDMGDPVLEYPNDHIKVDFGPVGLAVIEFGEYAKEADLVFCKSVIEHMQDPKILFDMLRAFCKEGTKVVIMTPDWRTYARVFYDDYTHVRPYDVVSLRDCAVAHGMQVDSCELVYQHVGLVQSIAQRILGKILTCALREDVVCALSDRLRWPWLRWAKLKTVMLTGTFPSKG